MIRTNICSLISTPHVNLGLHTRDLSLFAATSSAQLLQQRALPSHPNSRTQAANSRNPHPDASTTPNTPNPNENPTLTHLDCGRGLVENVAASRSPHSPRSSHLYGSPPISNHSDCKPCGCSHDSGRAANEQRFQLESISHPGGISCYTQQWIACHSIHRLDKQQWK